jgi:hypothetical protein
VIYENTFSPSILLAFPTLSRIDDYILPEDEFYKAPDGQKGKGDFSPFSSAFTMYGKTNFSDR